MRKALQCFAAFILGMFSTLTFSSDIPRLWEVTGNEEKFYLLAITHYGLDVEYDDYLERKVVPIFEKVDVLAYEASVVFPTTPKECRYPWPKTPENSQLLKLARERVKTLLMLMFREQAPKSWNGEELASSQEKAAAAMAASYSEYGLVSAMKTFENSITPSDEKKFKFGRGQVTRYLLNKRKNIAVESVDTTDEYIAAYCNIKETRPEYFRELIKSPRFNDLDSLSQSEIQAANNDFRESIVSRKPHGIYGYRIAEREKSLVCDRTENWIKKISDNQKKGSYFYALGVNHFLPSDTPNLCSGLLADLEKKGFTIRLIE